MSKQKSREDKLSSSVYGSVVILMFNIIFSCGHSFM